MRIFVHKIIVFVTLAVSLVVAAQCEEYRNQWLEYALDRLHKTDPNGHLRMCLIRMVTGKVGETSLRSYFANTRSDACPVGYSQKETIKRIWSTRL